MDGIFTSRLLEWYDHAKRDLPWRKTRDPYAIWISEIMAQQTQIDRVIGYWERWMQRYPDIATLAQAAEDDVLHSWEGLGYYSRARNLHKAAGLLYDEYGASFPSDIDSIVSLPGIGQYTAGAIASIAFGFSVPAVDANVLRVFSRLLDIAIPVRQARSRRIVEETVTNLIPEDRAGDFNQAIMEFGALVCAKRPRCDACPVSDLCLAYDRGGVHERPVLPPSKGTIKIDMATGVLLHEGGVLIQKRLPDDIWPGLWEFPGGVIESGETPREALIREYEEEVELAVVPGEKITVITYSYTRYRVTMHCYYCRLSGSLPEEIVFNEAAEGRFVCPEALHGFAFPAGHRRLIDHIMKEDNLCFIGNV